MIVGAPGVAASVHSAGISWNQAVLKCAIAVAMSDRMQVVAVGRQVGRDLPTAARSIPDSGRQACLGLLIMVLTPQEAWPRDLGTQR